MIIALIGLGAIGTIISTDLALSGWKIYIVCKNKTVENTVIDKGLRIDGKSGEYIVTENIIPVLSIDDLPNKIDIAFITSRARDVKKIVLDLKSKLADNPTIIPCQNGIVEEELATVIPDKYILSCVISYAACRIDNAHSRITSIGQIVFGRFTGDIGEHDMEILKRISIGGSCIWSDNIMGYKFSKLLINSSISSLGIISAMTVGELLKRKKTRIVLMTIVTEGLNVASAANIDLEVLNKLDPKKFRICKDDLQGFSFSLIKKHIILRFIGYKYRKHRSAALEILESGKPTEIDYLNGYIVSKGKLLNINTPVNDYLTQKIHEIESNEYKSEKSTLELIEDFSTNFWNEKI